MNVWAEYDLTNRWEIGAGLNYVGERTANVVTEDNPRATVPGFVVFNAMTSFKINQRLSLQVNALNLCSALYYDAFYYTSATENHAIPGPGRTVKFTLQASF